MNVNVSKIALFCIQPLIFVVAVISVAFNIVRRFFKGGQFTEQVSGEGLVAVVTGANTGIGLETVRGLSAARVKVYMLCRDTQKGVEARTKLAQMGCDSTKLVLLRCDLADFSTVRECAESILRDEEKIDILVNNAGIMFYPKYERTVDGHEVTWQSNHLGHVLLTELLLPALKRASSARIIFVSSRLHHLCRSLDLATVDDKEAFGLLSPYTHSKLAKVMYARELSKRLHKQGIHNVFVNSLHPGVVDSSLCRHTILAKTPFQELIAPIRWLCMKSDRDGAQTSLYLALSKNVDGISGKYFMDCKIARENPLALNDRACEEVYDYSLQQCGIAA
ncbi:unnamed protein product [Cylicocyclus nassatus]|uniref:Uncharacterized protein n=1 Tax=Cylicocyclus nassatus TaxID=53992 RepID=A0AA36GFK1_CYLNA|nr:unnamed protein product [Cylicocyclus nassatus]